MTKLVPQTNTHHPRPSQVDFSIFVMYLFCYTRDTLPEFVCTTETALIQSKKLDRQPKKLEQYIFQQNCFVMSSSYGPQVIDLAIVNISVCQATQVHRGCIFEMVEKLPQSGMLFIW